MATTPDRKTPAKGKSKRGGRREGSGRKPKEFHALRAEIVANCERLNVEILPQLFENMLRLAHGGYRRVEEKWLPSGADGTGELVLAERKVSVADADRAANQYMIDRIMGKPRQSIDVTTTDEGGGARDTLERKLARLHGPAD